MNSPADRLKSAVPGNDSGADDTEHHLWSGRYSPLAMIGWLVAAAAATIAFPFLANLTPLTESSLGWLAVGLPIAALWIWVFAVLGYRMLSRHYELTSQRLKHRRGILFRKINRIELIDVDDVMYRQGPIQTLLGVGTVHLKSSDTTDPEFELVGIAGVRHVSEMIDDARRKERRLRGLHIEAV